MYPHNIKHVNNDTVQLEAPEYDPDRDSNNNNTHQKPICAMGSTDQTSNYEWNIPIYYMPTALSQTPRSLGTPHPKPTGLMHPPSRYLRYLPTTTDIPPEVEYHKRTAIHIAQEDVPELEEDEDQQDYINNHHLITHHNTHQESERITREYTERLQDLNDQQY